MMMSGSQKMLKERREQREKDARDAAKTAAKAADELRKQMLEEARRRARASSVPLVQASAVGSSSSSVVVPLAVGSSVVVPLAVGSSSSSSSTKKRERGGGDDNHPHHASSGGGGDDEKKASQKRLRKEEAKANLERLEKMVESLHAKVEVQNQLIASQQKEIAEQTRVIASQKKEIMVKNEMIAKQKKRAMIASSLVVKEEEGEDVNKTKTKQAEKEEDKDEDDKEDDKAKDKEDDKDKDEDSDDEIMETPFQKKMRLELEKQKPPARALLAVATASAERTSTIPGDHTHDVERLFGYKRFDDGWSQVGVKYLAKPGLIMQGMRQKQTASQHRVLNYIYLNMHTTPRCYHFIFFIYPPVKLIRDRLIRDYIYGREKDVALMLEVYEAYSGMLYFMDVLKQNAGEEHTKREVIPQAVVDTVLACVKTYIFMVNQQFEIGFYPEITTTKTRALILDEIVFKLLSVYIEPMILLTTKTTTSVEADEKEETNVMWRVMGVLTQCYGKLVRIGYDNDTEDDDVDVKNTAIPKLKLLKKIERDIKNITGVKIGERNRRLEQWTKQLHSPTFLVDQVADDDDVVVASVVKKDDDDHDDGDHDDEIESGI